MQHARAACRPETSKTVLGWVTTPPIEGKHFSKVVLMGPYWSGTNAVREEILWRFPQSEVLNPDKLDVTVGTPEHLRTLCDGLASGPVLNGPLWVGRRRVPSGYKLSASRGVARSVLAAARESHSSAENADAALSSGGAGDGDVLEGSAESQAAEGLAAVSAECDASGEGGDAEPRSTDSSAWPVAEESSGISMPQPPFNLAFGPDTAGRCGWWKHAVRPKSQGPIDTDEDTLVVLVTKDPLFWLKSVSKHYYEIRASEGSRAGLDNLFGELQHAGRHYKDAVELWSAAMGSFLDEELYPSSRCVLLRYEDFLFRFWDVVVHLSAFLTSNGERLKEPPIGNRLKAHGGDEVRGRDQALKYYAWTGNRHCDFDRTHLERMRELDPVLLRALGYQPAPGVDEAAAVALERRLCHWVPRLRRGDVVAARLTCVSPTDRQSFCCYGRCTAGRAWALVVGASDDDDPDGASCMVGITRQVPFEWLAAVAGRRDWSAIEWPERARSPALALLNGTKELRLDRDSLDLRLPGRPCSFARRDENDDVEEEPDMGFGTSSCSSASLPLTEEGYRAAVLLRSTRAMADFVQRVIADLDVRGAKHGRVLDRHKLLGFARWFSGEASVQSLAQIRRELPGKESENWVTFAAAPPPRPLRDLPATLVADAAPAGPPPTRAPGPLPAFDVESGREAGGRGRAMSTPAGIAASPSAAAEAAARASS